jgi:hypothetical protein
VATMVSHWRPVYEFPPEPAGQAPSLLVDPKAAPVGKPLGDPSSILSGPSGPSSGQSLPWLTWRPARTVPARPGAGGQS